MTCLTRSLTSVNSLYTSSVRTLPHLFHPSSALCGFRFLDSAKRDFTSFSFHLSTSENRDSSSGFLQFDSQKAGVRTMSGAPDSGATGRVGESFIHVDGERESYMDLNESVVVVNQDGSESEGFASEKMPSEEVEGEGLRILPDDPLKKAVVLTCDSVTDGGSCNVYLVGTAHVSQESCMEVQSVISYLKPQVVFLELCPSRVSVLSPQNLKVPTIGEMINMWKKNHNLFGILYSWFLAKVASQLDVFPGSEFRVAFEEARKYGGKVVLGDRPVHITLRRTWEKMPFMHKVMLIYSLLFQAVFLPSPEELNKMLKRIDDVDALTLVIQEMSKEFPSLMETLVDERDKYMSFKLLAVAKQHTSVVAVVGKGHLQGIKKYWKQPIQINDLLEIPSRKRRSRLKVISSLGIVFLGAAVISGIYVASKK